MTYDLSKLPAVRVQLERDLAAKAGAIQEEAPSPDEPPPRQFPLAGQSQARPLADPTRAGGKP